MGIRTGMILTAAVLLAGLPARAGGWFKAIEVSTEEAVEGTVDVSVRMQPGKTFACERIEFECVYHQEFPWQNVRGKKYIKKHEPVTFMYRRDDVRLVNDLDAYVSFRAPYGLPALSKKYGPKVFNADYPVTIDRIRITGYDAGGRIWRYEVPVNRTLDAAALSKQDPVESEEP